VNFIDLLHKHLIFFGLIRVTPISAKRIQDIHFIPVHRGKQTTQQQRMEVDVGVGNETTMSATGQVVANLTNSSSIPVDPSIGLEFFPETEERLVFSCCLYILSPFISLLRNQ
jgi:hypothetical protein